MSCDRWRDAVSALADGEDPGVDPRLLERHLDACPACRSFRAAAEANRRRTLIHAAPPTKDVSRRVTKLNAIADRAAAWSIVRVALAVIAIEIVALSLPALVLGDEADTSAHAARHLGAFSIAYGVALIVVVVRPARARTVLPVAAVLAGTLVITAVIDAINGHVPFSGEVQHVPELISVLLVWMLAVPSPRRQRAATIEPPAPLRAVDGRRDTG